MTTKPQMPNETRHKELLEGATRAVHHFHEFLEITADAYSVQMQKSLGTETKILRIRAEINTRLNRLARAGDRDEWEQLFDMLQEFDGICNEWNLVFQEYAKRIRNATR